MPKITLRAKLPTGDANGLQAHAENIVDDPDKLRLALVLLGTPHVIDDRENLDHHAVLAIRRVEIVSDKGDVEVLQRIMLRANEARTGNTMLPFETERAIADVFAEFAKTDDDDPDGAE